MIEAMVPVVNVMSLVGYKIVSVQTLITAMKIVLKLDNLMKKLTNVMHLQDGMKKKTHQLVLQENVKTHV